VTSFTINFKKKTKNQTKCRNIWAISTWENTKHQREWRAINLQQRRLGTTLTPINDLVWTVNQFKIIY